MSPNKSRGVTKLAKAMAVAALLVAMALSNPGKQKFEAKFGERLQSTFNLVIFTVVSVAPLPGSPLQLNIEEKIKTQRRPDGLANFEYHIGIFGHIF